MSKFDLHTFLPVISTLLKVDHLHKQKTALFSDFCDVCLNLYVGSAQHRQIRRHS